MADAGFDVWLPNSRGVTPYSRKHVSKDPEDPNSGFWAFSFTEMGLYDHPAVIDYVLNQTGQTKVRYIGHSQGTSSLFVLLSLKPEYNEKISIASLMAPVAIVENVGDEIKNYYRSFLFHWVGDLKELFHSNPNMVQPNVIFFLQFQPERNTEFKRNSPIYNQICRFKSSKGERNKVSYLNVLERVLIMIFYFSGISVNGNSV